jgi:hypothetical protein
MSHSRTNEAVTEINKLSHFIDTFRARFSSLSPQEPAPASIAATVNDQTFQHYAEKSHRSTQRLWPNLQPSSEPDGRPDEPPLTYREISSILSLKPSDMNSFCALPPHIISSPDRIERRSTVASLTYTLSYHPVLPLDLLMTSSHLQSALSFYSESLLMDAMFIQSVFGYSIAGSEPSSVAQTAQILQQILDNGVTYVISQPSSKLMILFPMQRSMILLRPISEGTDSNKQPPPPPPLAFQKRMKDFPRIFRNKICQNRLSFRINSNFEYTVQQLREYHSRTIGEETSSSPPPLASGAASASAASCWINSDLEMIWKYFIEQKTFYIFELWLLGSPSSSSSSLSQGGGDDVLLAADYCHISNKGTGVYVATRYHNNQKEYKTWQSGYLLASLSCQYLQQKGYSLWDLGGVDLCPLMRYKIDVTGKPFHRAEALYLLNRIRLQCDDGTSTQEEKKEEKTMSRIQEIESGNVIENISLEDVMWK